MTQCWNEDWNVLIVFNMHKQIANLTLVRQKCTMSCAVVCIPPEVAQLVHFSLLKMAHVAGYILAGDTKIAILSSANKVGTGHHLVACERRLESHYLFGCGSHVSSLLYLVCTMTV